MITKNRTRINTAAIKIEYTRNTETLRYSLCAQVLYKAERKFWRKHDQASRLKRSGKTILLLTLFFDFFFKVFPNKL